MDGGRHVSRVLHTAADRGLANYLLTKGSAYCASGIMIQQAM